MTQTVAACMAALEAHRVEISQHGVADFFAADPNRFQRYHVTLDDLLFDYSKHRANDATLAHLLTLARVAGVEKARERLFGGDLVNHTEGRPALHMALRNFSDTAMRADGVDVSAQVLTERERVFASPMLSERAPCAGRRGKPSPMW